MSSSSASLLDGLRLPVSIMAMSEEL